MIVEIIIIIELFKTTQEKLIYEILKIIKSS